MTQPMSAEKIRFDQAVVFTVVVPVVYAALRLMIFARGDTNRLRALVANLDVKAVILGTVLPLGATFLFWAMWVFAFDVVSKSKAAERGGVAEAVAKKHSQSTLLAVSMIGIIAVWWAMPMRHMAINGAILAGFMLALLGRKRRQQGPIAILSSVVGLILLLAFLVVPLIAVFSGDAWLPRERLRLADGSTQEVYMLTSDADWTKYLDMSRDPHIIASSNVMDRQAVITPHSNWNRTLADITGVG